MSIDDKIRGIGIKRMLVVDDRVDHIEAAREYFKGYKSVQIDYAWSAQEAIKKIQDAYPQQKYDLVLSDMQMEEITSGQDVMKEVAKYPAFGIVVTSRGAGSHGDKHWGEGTKMIGPSFEYVVEGRKSEPETWRILTEKSAEYIQDKAKWTLHVIKRWSERAEKPSERMAELIMMSYDFKGD